MKKSEWSDRELEELLRQMPRIHDHRDPRDIYQNISLKRKRIRPWVLPGLAATAALLLFLILMPKLIGGMHFSHESAEEKSASSGNTAMQKDSSAFKKEKASSKEAETNKTQQANLLKTENVKTAIYEDQVGKGTVLTYWVPDAQAQILIPVSIITNQSSGQSWLTNYTALMANLQEEEWGLADFYPLNATMKLEKDGNTVIVDVPADHQYGQGSTTETNFISVVQKDISTNSNCKKIKFTTKGLPGIELGNIGRKEEIDVASQNNHAYFLYFPEDSKLPFLAPSNETYNNINSAFEAMKTDQSGGLKSSLQTFPQIDHVSISNKIMDLSFDVNSSLQDNQESILSFEALLLTAKEFGIEKVRVRNSPLANLGPFDLTKEINVPIAPNLRNIP
ncbi:negative regulator of sigma-X activity [Bacillus sp. ISL-18]|uniref:negative regulator of sigma-X activity n=1 Tax=Bacillus sp. ISL-18 TaxID=2819118 RepID=UPI001BEB2A91|nr:negative regulator of sigma-X activity [Bacillus sp. ISL-18]MBT2656437.1 negative regulator of sigma-X activity [Bacillus sp. ISL-18]